MIFRSIIEISRIIPPGQFPRNFPLDNCSRTIPTQDNYPLDNCSTDNFYLGQLRPGQLPHEQLPAGQLSHRQVPPRTIAPRTIPQDNSHLWLLYCPRIYPRQLPPRAMTVTNYNFFMTIFCFFSMAQLYSFCAFCAFWVHSKICFRKGRRCCRKKVTKRKICSNVFNLTKKWFHSTKISNQSSMFVYLFIYLFLHIKFSCSDNITARNS